jgi:RNA polymerase sigma factor (sigma-70 family)
MAEREHGNADDLAARLRQGDESALEGVLRTHGPAVQRVLCRKFAAALREADVDDVLAIALFRLWQARDSYDAAKGSLRVWFFRIAENAARDVLRHGWHKARRLEVSEQRISLASLADRSGSGQSAVEPSKNGKPGHGATGRTSSERQTALREILAQLPEAQRRIIAADALCREGVASSKHLAEELQLSEASIRVYRKRAMDAIREQLTNRGLAPATERVV